MRTTPDVMQLLSRVGLLHFRFSCSRARQTGAMPRSGLLRSSAHWSWGWSSGRRYLPHCTMCQLPEGVHRISCTLQLCNQVPASQLDLHYALGAHTGPGAVSAHRCHAVDEGRTRCCAARALDAAVCTAEAAGEPATPISISTLRLLSAQTATCLAGDFSLTAATRGDARGDARANAMHHDA
jgi:hypothetical protein